MPMGKGTYGSQKGRPKEKKMMGGKMTADKKIKKGYKKMMGGGKMKYSMGGEVTKPN